MIRESDYLCTNCYTIEYNHMIKKFGTVKRLTNDMKEFMNDNMDDDYDNDILMCKQENEKSLEDTVTVRLSLSLFLCLSFSLCDHVDI